MHNTSLRLRLFLVLVAAVTLALGTVALIARQSTEREIDRFVVVRDAEEQARIEQVLARAARDRAELQAGRPVNGIPVPPPPPVPPDIQPVDPVRQIPWVEPVFPGDAADGGGWDGGNLDGALTLAVITGGTASIILALALAGRMLRPVSELTHATRRMANGDLSTRVTVRAHDEIGELGEAFNGMAGALTEAERLRQGMVTDIAHELRTPLTNLSGYLEAMRDGVIDPAPGVIASLHDEALLLGRLVDDLRDLSLAEAGRLRLERRPVELGRLMARSVAAFQPRATAAGVMIGEVAAPGLPLVEADPERIEQVLRNLLDNALRHTPAGGEVWVEAWPETDAVVLRVRDTGSGIPPEHLPFVFERFYRADASRSRDTGGSGLGLAIVKHLVERHGGRVVAESDGLSGTAITVWLPTGPVDETATTDRARDGSARRGLRYSRDTRPVAGAGPRRRSYRALPPPGTG